MSASPFASAAHDHADLMDRIYRGQRHIYDFTRKYYLFGRDRTIDTLACQPGDSVLEIACGTGRNLARVARKYPGVQLFGIDISREMLISAEKRLGAQGKMAAADACDFDPEAALGQPRFDRIMLSYCLSMIPDWEQALAHAAGMIAPGGSLHVVDFGDMAGLPGPVAGALRAWLARFHVTPRAGLRDASERIAAFAAIDVEYSRGPFGYYQQLRLQPRAI